MTKFIGFQPILFDAILQKGTGATCMAAPMLASRSRPQLSFQFIYSSLVMIGQVVNIWPMRTRETKTKPPGARSRRISCELCSRFCNLNTQLSSSYIY